MVRILEGESLLNDASGLVCLRFATAAALTGTFSLPSATVSFAWLLSGGVAVGIGTTWITARTKEWITRRVGEESGSQVIISLLIPFTAYLIAERLRCSGILAAVAAGVTMSVVEATGEAQALTRLHRNTIWDTVRFAGNGIIFVLLGEQMPAILANAHETVRVTGHQNPWWLLIYVVAINLGVATLRFFWVWVSLNLENFRTHLRGAAARTPNWQLVAATSVAGVRGAVTLAGVLTLPLALNDGTPFPGRDLAIFLATGVIVVSLLGASIGLPLLLRRLGKATNTVKGAEEDRAGIAAAEAAIAEIKRIQEELSAEGKDFDAYLFTATLITKRYRTRIAARSQAGRAATLARRHEAIERRMWVIAIRAERTTIFAMLRASQIGSETAHKLVRELDLLEARYEV
jgi:CPA1 family monovalent cation:H+ antiporter